MSARIVSLLKKGRACPPENPQHWEVAKTTAKRPTYPQKGPMYQQKSPMCPQKSPMYPPKRLDMFIFLDSLYFPGLSFYFDRDSFMCERVTWLIHTCAVTPSCVYVFVCVCVCV